MKTSRKKWLDNIFCTDSKMKPIHRHFHHPTTKKLYALLEWTNEDYVGPSTRRTLQKVWRTCEVCWRHDKKPHHFHVAISDAECIFNRTVGMDVLKTEKNTVHHMFDEDTKLSAATFLCGESSVNVWNAFV